MGKVTRQTVDLSAFPDLVVIYLGMRVNARTGLKRLLGLGPQIKNSVKSKAGRAPTPREFHLFIDPVAPWHASILARLRYT